MANERIFVGRKTELEQFKRILGDPKGQAVVVVGNRGMGKTWLVDRMGEIAEGHPGLKCGWVRYEVTPNDTPDSIMALMMDHAFEAAQVVEGSFEKTDRRRGQWKALLNIVKIGDLVETNDVMGVVEKERVSDYVTCGCYWFRSRTQFQQLSATVIEKHLTSRGQYYVGMACNAAIASGGEVRGYMLAGVQQVTTVEDLEALRRQHG